MEPDDFITCPECDFNFCVVWSNNPLGGPEYCPKCGDALDYAEAYRSQHEC